MEWHQYIEPYLKLGERLGPLLQDVDDEQARHELYEFIFSQISSGYPMLFYADPRYPDFWPMFNHVHNQGFPNPDTLYLTAPVETDGVYKVSGYLGTARISDIQQSGGTFITRGEIQSSGGGMGSAFGNYKFSDFMPDDGGYFEVVFSRKKPDGYQGQWRELNKQTTFLFVRQVMYDWQNETDTKVAIERLDIPQARPRSSAEDLAGKIKQLSIWAENYVRLSYMLIHRGRQDRKVNTFDFVHWGEAGFTTQKHLAATFETAPDEALIIESEVPEQCLYWGFQVGTAQWRDINPLQHQSSLNGFQARLDDDGKFRAVVCASDPGVPNWLDSAGYRSGEILARWNECDTAPVPSARVVKFSEIRQHLPDNTPRVTAEQRSRLMSDRRRALQLRKRW